MPILLIFPYLMSQRQSLFIVHYAPFQTFSMLSTYVHIYTYTYIHTRLHKQSIYDILEFYKPKFKKCLNGDFIDKQL